MKLFGAKKITKQASLKEPLAEEKPIYVRVSDLVKKIANGEISNVVALVGAGVSVSCGIPDFRSKESGLYHNLEKFDLPYAEAIFDLKYFEKTEGKAFYALAKEMWPDNFHPSPTHAFLRLLHEKQMLRRIFTQNIDTLERQAGIPAEKIIEAHGSYGSASCIKCTKVYDHKLCEAKIKNGETPIRCLSCNGLVKPDIVFFGEDLPSRFFTFRKTDMQRADLVIIIGTSLKVQPFAGLIDYCKKDCPRLLINLEPVGVQHKPEVGLRLRKDDNTRDYMIEGRCDDGVRALCDALNWRQDLETLVDIISGKEKVDNEVIDVDTSFPFMRFGLDYNWRYIKSTPKGRSSKTSKSFEVDKLSKSMETKLKL